MLWWKSFVSFIGLPGTSLPSSVKSRREAVLALEAAAARDDALLRARARRAAAFARHRDAVSRKDTRSIHFTRQALTRTTTALLRAEQTLSGSPRGLSHPVGGVY